jgi:hypothetical protein
VPQGQIVAVSPDGARFATTGPGASTVWDMATRERLFTFGGHDNHVAGLGTAMGEGTTMEEAERELGRPRGREVAGVVRFVARGA